MGDGNLRLACAKRRLGLSSRPSPPLRQKREFGSPLAPVRRFMLRRCRLPPPPPQRHPPLLYDQATNQYPAGPFSSSFFSPLHSILCSFFNPKKKRKRRERIKYLQKERKKGKTEPKKPIIQNRSTSVIRLNTERNSSGNPAARFFFFPTSF